MKDVDFSICPFIKKELSFLTYYDFCDNAIAIRDLYKKLSNEEKQFYKWFVYSNIHMREYYKDLIWGYLNDHITRKILMENRKRYKIK